MIYDSEVIDMASVSPRKTRTDWYDSGFQVLTSRPVCETPREMNQVNSTSVPVQMTFPLLPVQITNSDLKPVVEVFVPRIATPQKQTSAMESSYGRYILSTSGSHENYASGKNPYIPSLFSIGQNSGTSTQITGADGVCTKKPMMAAIVSSPETIIMAQMSISPAISGADSKLKPDAKEFVPRVKTLLNTPPVEINQYQAKGAHSLTSVSTQKHEDTPVSDLGADSNSQAEKLKFPSISSTSRNVNGNSIETAKAGESTMVENVATSKEISSDCISVPTADHDSNMMLAREKALLNSPCFQDLSVGTECSEKGTNSAQSNHNRYGNTDTSPLDEVSAMDIERGLEDDTCIHGAKTNPKDDVSTMDIERKLNDSSTTGDSSDDESDLEWMDDDDEDDSIASDDWDSSASESECMSIDESSDESFCIEFEGAEAVGEDVVDMAQIFDKGVTSQSDDDDDWYEMADGGDVLDGVADLQDHNYEVEAHVDEEISLHVNNFLAQNVEPVLSPALVRANEIWDAIPLSENFTCKVTFAADEDLVEIHMYESVELEDEFAQRDRMWARHKELKKSKSQ